MKKGEKFVHYTVVTFTYGIGLGTACAIVFALITVIERAI